MIVYSNGLICSWYWVVTQCQLAHICMKITSYKYQDLGPGPGCSKDRYCCPPDNHYPAVGSIIIMLSTVKQIIGLVNTYPVSDLSGE